MNLRQIFATALLPASLLATSAAAEPVFTCVVEDMSLLEPDPAFIAENMQKTYRLAFSERQITLTQTSGAFENYEQAFTIINRSLLGVMAARVDMVGIRGLVINLRDDNGHYDATLTTQISFAVNVWKLDCIAA